MHLSKNSSAAAAAYGPGRAPKPNAKRPSFKAERHAVLFRSGPGSCAEWLRGKYDLGGMGNSSSSEDSGSDGEAFEWLPRRIGRVAKVSYNATSTDGATARRGSVRLRDANVLVVRRGGTLPLTVILPRWTGGGRGDIVVEASLLPSAEGNMPTVRIPEGSDRLVEINKHPGCVSVVDVRPQRKAGETCELTVNVHVPIAAAIGRYALAVQCSSRSGSEKVRVFLDEAVFLTYNARSEFDCVHVDSNPVLADCVDSEAGQVCLGTLSRPEIKSCYFGQCSWSVVSLAAYLLARVRGKTESEFGACALVEDLVRLMAEQLAKTVSEAKEKGQCCEEEHHRSVGYDSSLLAEWLMQGRDVFDSSSAWTVNALLVSVLRAIGVPCRLVTAYNVADSPAPTGAVDALLVDQDLRTRNFLRCVCVFMFL